jgi:primosomal replication protein N
LRETVLIDEDGLFYCYFKLSARAIKPSMSRYSMECTSPYFVSSNQIPSLTQRRRKMGAWIPCGGGLACHDDEGTLRVLRIHAADFHGDDGVGGDLIPFGLEEAILRLHQDEVASAARDGIFDADGISVHAGAEIFKALRHGRQFGEVEASQRFGFRDADQR